MNGILVEYFEGLLGQRTEFWQFRRRLDTLVIDIGIYLVGIEK